MKLRQKPSAVAVMAIAVIVILSSSCSSSSPSLPSSISPTSPSPNSASQESPANLSSARRGSIGLSTPILQSPENGATDTPTDVTVRWTLSNPGETYRVQVSTDSKFNSFVLDAQVADATGYTVFGLFKNTTYNWRVNASANGQTSPWSRVWSFTTTNKSIPAAPVLVTPENGATGLPDDPTLVWKAVEGADSYDIQLGTKPDFSSWNRTKWSWVGTSIRVFADLDDYSHTFYWRVRAKNPAGVSAWSAPWGFTCTTFGCD